MGEVLVIGGYGNAGSAIVGMLLAHSEHRVVVAGRNPRRAEQLVARLTAAHPEWGARLGVTRLDAERPETLTPALATADLCLAAAGTSQSAVAAVEACLAARCDYLDIQVSQAKATRLMALDARAREAGVAVVTDGGFQPGVPAAMIRYADARLGPLHEARVSSVIAVDWAELLPLADSTVPELMEEFRDFAYEEYRGGRWLGAKGQRRFDFPAPFGRRTAAAMGLAEMRQVTAALPDLRDAGFYVGGFNPVVDYAIIPVAWAGMRVAPGVLARPLGRLVHWGLVRFGRPPYGTILQLDGAREGEVPRTLMRLSHPDAYAVTAAPAAAAALQLLDGTVRRAGAHTQAMLVEPTRFFADIASMGVRVEWLGQT